MVLAEMRQMLRSIADVLTGLAEGDTSAAATAARASGMAAAVDVAPEVAVLLPNAFIQLGMSTHQGFDALADQLEAAVPQQQALAALAGLTQNCVACHASYRIDEAP
jgi:ABC-type sulfate transport system substrate-binding protein